MRLLDTRTGLFRSINNPGDQIYAVLSHTWSEDGEQSYQDLVKIQESVRRRHQWKFLGIRRDDEDVSILSDHRVSSKIRQACAVAAANRYELLWVDSCCIDKSSSAELSEGINSMFEWYSQAHICYVYLEDVDDAEDDSENHLYSQLRRCRWRTRGWTLQELIAPKRHIFLSRFWRPLGTKHSLARLLEKVTGVDYGILLHEKGLDTVSVARRMWWASRRQTTRIEDEAYSLMGIFGVHMPTVYGEGRHAFVRLQEEILKRIPDQSIFAWGPHFPVCIGQLERLLTLDARYLLAESPLCFESAGSISVVTRERLRSCVGSNAYIPPPEYSITSSGIRTCLPIISPSSGSGLLSSDTSPNGYHYHLAILACKDHSENLVALPLQLLNTGLSQHEYVVVGYVEERASGIPELPIPCRTISLSPADIKRRACAMTDVYIHYPRVENDIIQKPPYDPRFIFSPLHARSPVQPRSDTPLPFESPPRFSIEQDYSVV